jgi:ATP-dependent DNA helicase RecG
MKVSDSVEALKGVGPALAKKLAKLDVHTIEDLILYYPRRYDDFSDIKEITRLKPGPVSIRAKIKQVKGRYVRGGLHITEAVASDKTSSIRLIWFNQPYREKAIKADKEYFISGNLELKRMQFAINNPSMELVSDFPVNTARIIPIYKEHKDIKSSEIRKAIREAFDVIEQVVSVLPPEIEKENKLISRKQALEQIHFPASKKSLDEARYRIGFEEVFELMVANMLLKRDLEAVEAIPVSFKAEVAKAMVKELPFELTDAQRAATWEIYQDIAKTHPMNRLLEGDVGSGKTAVAAMAALMCIDQGYQAAFMAPTELLARQHAETLLQMLKPLKLDHHVCLLVGGMSASQ